MNKWKKAFWICLITMTTLLIFCLYTNLDQAVLLTDMQKGYSYTSHDLENLIKIINETDLTKGQINKLLSNHDNYEFMDFKSDTVALNRKSLIFREDTLFKVTTIW